MATEFSIGQDVGLTIAYTDAGGNAATKPGAVTWTSSDVTIATVTAGTDDTTATAKAVKEGNATITAVSGTVTATLDLTVAAGVATTGTITAGTPTTPSS